MLSVSVVMIAYNEEANLRPCVEEALPFLRGNTEDFQLVIVDDGSQDRTVEVARELQALDPERIDIVSYSPNRGMGGALKAGFERCRLEWVTWLPSDGQVPAAGLRNMFTLIETDPELGLVTTTFPSRFEDADSVLRKVLSRGLRWVMWGSTGVSREMDGIYLVRRVTLQALPLRSDTFFLNLEVPIRAIRAGLKTGHVTLPIRPRMSGQSKVVNLPKIQLVLRETLRLGRELRYGYRG